MGRRSASSLLLRVDPRAPETLQGQIYTEIRRAILEGVVEPGTRLPSTRALALDLGVSRTTTLLALDQLLAEGYLAARRGSGTYVALELPDDLPDLLGAAAPVPEALPPLSRLGASLAAAPAGARRVAGPPCAFRLGIPGLDLFPSRLWGQLVQRRWRRATPGQLDYGDPAGLPALREAIAEHVTRSRGTRCSAAEVVVTSGAMRGVEIIARLLVDPGDAIWMEEPGYPGAWSALRASGARLRPVPVDGEGLDVEAGRRRERATAPARLAYVTPSHQYPLGVPMSLPRRLALLRWAGAARAWVVEDDYDSEFRYGARPIPCLHGLDNEGRVIYTGSFAKTLYPALRLGFLLVPPGLRDRLVAVRRGVDLHPPTLDQAVLADFLREGHYERHIRRMRAAYRERLEALGEAAKQLCGGVLHLRPVHTGLHAVADLSGVAAERVFEEALRRGVETMPLSAYYLRGSRGESSPRRSVPNALLLGFAPVAPEALRRGMEQLARAIEAVGG